MEPPGYKSVFKIYSIRSCGSLYMYFKSLVVKGLKPQKIIIYS